MLRGSCSVGAAATEGLVVRPTEGRQARAAVHVEQIQVNKRLASGANRRSARDTKQRAEARIAVDTGDGCTWTDRDLGRLGAR